VDERCNKSILYFPSAAGVGRKIPQPATEEGQSESLGGARRRMRVGAVRGGEGIEGLCFLISFVLGTRQTG